ncbi:MAG: SGNH/GDSL hydrolase family protein [Victivallaceae bacterium]
MTATQKTITSAALCALTATGFAGDVLYSCPGKISDKTAGWKFIPSANPGGQVYNQAEGYYPDKGGQLLGPAIPATKNEFEFYSLTFDAKAPNDCCWGVFFNDKNGKMLVSDIYSSVYANKGKCHYEQVIYGREHAAAIHPFLQSVKGIEAWNLQIKPIPAKDAAEWCDRLYQTLPPLSYVPPANRLKLLPKTVEAMKTGKPWRVVMLGDSIINDTFNSNFQSLLMRQYPKADLKFICSVRGSTGCWYYQDSEQFKSYVTDLKPDLLIIGGISQKDDIAAIRKVIEMTKQQIGCEILLMSGPLGNDWRLYDENNLAVALPAQTWTTNPFVEKQRQLAEEQKVEFLDMATIWHNYLGQSGKPWQWFQRDVVHGNDRGKQIAGRIVETYFKL